MGRQAKRSPKKEKYQAGEKNGDYLRVTYVQNQEVNKLGSKDFISSQANF